MDDKNFDKRKSAALQAILNACEFDKSPKGSVDEPIRSLVDMLNASKDYATTSSCSGRISLFHTIGSDTPQKGEGKWLIALHRCLTDSGELVGAIEQGVHSSGSERSMTIFKHEPFVLHVMCRSVERAQELLKVAMDTGFRESGISVGTKKIMVGIRTTSNSLECPVACDGNVLCTREYLEFLTDEANKRFVENARRTRKFEDAVRSLLSTRTEEAKSTDAVNKSSVSEGTKKATPQVDSAFALKRWGHSSTQIGPDSILIFGGWGEFSSTTTKTGSREKVDKLQHSHLAHSLMLNPSNAIMENFSSDVEPSGRVYHTASRLEGHEPSCLVFGGRKSPQNVLNDLWIFNGKNKTWKSSAPEQDGQQRPSARWRHAEAAIGDSVYIYGGRNLEEVLSDLWKITVKDGDASVVKTEPIEDCTGQKPGPRFSHAMVGCKKSQQLLLHGGLSSFDAHDGPAEVFALDLNTRVWSSIEIQGLEWRFAHQWVSDLDGINSVVIGGVGKTYNRDILCGSELLQVNILDLTSRRVRMNDVNGVLAVQHSANLYKSSSDVVLLLGGGATCFAFGSVFSESSQMDLQRGDAKPLTVQLRLKDMNAISNKNNDKATARQVLGNMGSFWKCKKANAVDVKLELAAKGMLDKSRKVVTKDDHAYFPIFSDSRKQVQMDMGGCVVEDFDQTESFGGSNNNTLIKANDSKKEEKEITQKKELGFWECKKLNAVEIKIYLDEHGLLDKMRKVQTESEFVYFPVSADANFCSLKIGRFIMRPQQQQHLKQASRHEQGSTDSTSVVTTTTSIKSAKQKDVLDAVLKVTHYKVDRIDDALLIHSREMKTEDAVKIPSEEWNRVLQTWGANAIVWGAEVDMGPMRESRHVLLHSIRPFSRDEFWVTVKENGVLYSFDMLKCMFSKGNVSEKARFASLIQPGETVVDLFAGIGYFTVSALKLSPHARMIHSCEWNPHSVKALRVNLKQNQVSHRCQIHPGDCRTLRLLGEERAHRVSLGLLPSSRVGWETAIKCLRDEGGWLHVHENGAENKLDELKQAVESQLTELAKRLRGEPWRARCFHVQCVKSYAPRVVHVVLDVKCGPDGSALVLQTTNNSYGRRLDTPQFLEKKETKQQKPSKKLASQLRVKLREVADDVLCAAGNRMELDEAQMVAADAELLFKRTLRRLANDFNQIE